MRECSRCGYSFSDELDVCPACEHKYVPNKKRVRPAANTAPSQDGYSIFVRGADLIDDNALYQAGLCKLNGLGMDKDEKEAMEIFRILAFRGHLDGMFKLAEMYLNETLSNEEVAKKWLKIAAEGGHNPSLIKLKMLGGSFTATHKREPDPNLSSADSFEERVQEVLPCIVSINSVCKVGSSIVSSHGTGFIVEGGYVISNAHVIGDKPQSIAARFDPSIDSGEYQLEPLKIHKKYDIAVLKFKGYFDERISARQNLALRDGGVKLGEEVYTIGNPLVLGLSVSKGVVSAPEREYSYKGVDKVVQTDITINHGNSGGALLDKNNNVLGVMTFVPGASEGGIGMAVPSVYIEKVLDIID